METIGWPELLVIGLVFVLLFGTKKIPELGKGLGDGIKSFKAALKGPTPEEKPAAAAPAEKPAEAAPEEQPAEKV
ncbi:MAG TPA: twin-arginine translocase TatA/TatE family subunit [Bryobacteraceae bacterium]|nr:twin-arginine translocase TatA/TatE family subunit [Bryobacteraceae bacterium]